MNSPLPGRPPRPVVPWLVLAGFGLLFLSWVAFMGHYVLKLVRRPASAGPPPQVQPATNTVPANAP